MKYTQIPSDAFQKLQLNAGILTDSFEPSTGVVGNIIGATSGGISFTAVPSWIDLGEGVDNCKTNTMELKRLSDWAVSISGTFLTVSTTSAKRLLAAADIDSDDSTHIVPRGDLTTEDFADIWWVGDYSNKNSGNNAGFVAIHVMNGLSTGGFQIKSADKGKGELAFEFTGHYSIDSDDVPFEIFVSAGA